MSQQVADIQNGITRLRAAGCTLLAEVLEKELVALIKEQERAA